MAGDWIKMRGNLWDDPRVGRLVDLTEASEAAVIGALYWLWATADQHTEDGILPGLSLRQIDRKTSVPGFATALVEIGWLEDTPDGVRIVRFEEHNGASAKRRCMEAQRKANSRNLSASDADNKRTELGQIPPNCVAREEKRREREEEPKTLEPSALVVSELTPCPHEEIISLYAELLPELPQIRKWEGTRARHLKARWSWVLADLKSRGKPFDKPAGLDFFRRMFGYINKSDFLMGRSGGFSCSLPWIVNDENFSKIIEGNYENKEAAA